MAAVRRICVRRMYAVRHKKTTHRFDRRLVESVRVSTAYIVRLPNMAGFGIRGDVDESKWIGLIVF
jgi:hypothetical protein